MEYLKITLMSLLIAVLISLNPQANAQDTSATLTITTPVDGDIGNGSSQIWTFSAVEGEVLSFVIHTTSGNLDPQFTISNSKGEPFLSNDDYAYPDYQDALLEAITMPRTDTYRLTVTGVGTTSGGYSLTMSSGFSQTALNDNFNGNLQWQDANTANEAFTVKNDTGQMLLALSGPDSMGIAINPKQTAISDYFATVKVAAIGGQDGWIVGMTLRQTDRDNYYLLNLSSHGQWRFTARQNGATAIIRDWTDHPALSNTSGDFILGAMVNGTGFDFFYNGVLFGRLSDSTLSKTGVIGLAVGTFSSLTSQTTARFDDLVVTVPVLEKGKRIIPQQIALGQPVVLTRDLQRRGLIPATGQLAFNVPESFIESVRPGVNSVPLARGATYTNLAIGTTVSWETNRDGLTGCGLILQSIDDTTYTLAYVDHNGAYGVSQRQNDHFNPGIYAEDSAASGNNHSLIVILQKDLLLYYVDGLYSGSMTYTAVEGGVGNAVVNFEPIHTSCKFTDTWVWNWDH